MTAVPSHFHLFLTGYRGSGKSSIAKALAPLLSMEAVDTDLLVESRAEKSIADIFAQDGEVVFRNWESNIISETSLRATPTIISLGGGAILRAENRNLIRASGWCAWLRASPQELARRISLDSSTASHRPSLSKLGVLGEIESILQQRTPLYLEVAQAEYDTECNSLESIIERIAFDYNAWVRANLR